MQWYILIKMKSIVGIGLNQNALDTEGLYDVVIG